MKAILLSFVLCVSACNIENVKRPPLFIEGRVDSLVVSRTNPGSGRPNNYMFTVFFEEGRFVSFDGVSSQPIPRDEDLRIYYHDINALMTCWACKRVDSVKVSRTDD